MNDLRDHLFETLELLKDPDKPMDIERAKAVADVAQTLINSAKVEVEFIKVVSDLGPGVKLPSTALLSLDSSKP